MPVALRVGCGGKPDVGAANELVDTAKNPKLHFVARDITLNKGLPYERTFAVVVPEDWKWQPSDQRFYADDADHMSIRTSCLGDPCTVGDFKRELDKDLEERINVVRAKVLENRSTPNERKFVTKDVAGRIAIDRAWWSGETPTEYFSCAIVTREELEPSRAAFERACDLATIR